MKARPRARRDVLNVSRRSLLSGSCAVIAGGLLVWALSSLTAPYAAAASSMGTRPSGAFMTASVRSQGLAQSSTPVGWSVTPSPNTRAALNILQAVAPVSSVDVWAVGYTSNQITDSGLIEHFNGFNWSVVPTPVPGPFANSALRGVSAVSANDVWAVGNVSNVGIISSARSPERLLRGHSRFPSRLSHQQASQANTLIEHFNGFSWSVVPSPNTSLAVNTLSSVLAISASDVWVVGYARGTGTNALDVPLIEHFNGFSWSIVASPNPSGTTSNNLELLSASSASDIWAIGDISSANSSSGEFETLMEHFNGFSWSVVSSPVPTGSLLNDVDGLSVISPSDAWAVGWSVSAGSSKSIAIVQRTLIEHFNGFSWSIVASPNMSSVGNMLDGVAALGPNNVWAVGAWASSGLASPGAGYTLVEHFNGTSWSLMPSPSPPGTLDSELNAIATVPFSSTQAWAVGDTNNSSTSPNGVATSATTLVAHLAPLPLPPAGYDIAASDGGVFAFGSAVFHGSMGGRPLNKPVVGAAADTVSKGYWLVASDGGVFSFDAPFYGSMGGRPLNSPIVGMAATPFAGGYWLVAADGGMFSFGDAPFYGSMGGRPLNSPIVGMASTFDGGGYWLVAADGGVFAFGDAVYHGSMGGRPLAKPVVGIATTSNMGGYWLVASDGGVFAFGNAPYHGSVPGLLAAYGLEIGSPVVGATMASNGTGYWLVTAAAGVVSFGAAFYGSMLGRALNGAVVAISTG